MDKGKAGQSSLGSTVLAERVRRHPYYQPRPRCRAEAVRRSRIQKDPAPAAALASLAGGMTADALPRGGSAPEDLRSKTLSRAAARSHYDVPLVITRAPVLLRPPAAVPDHWRVQGSAGGGGHFVRSLRSRGWQIASGGPRRTLHPGTCSAVSFRSGSPQSKGESTGRRFSGGRSGVAELAKISAGQSRLIMPLARRATVPPCSASPSLAPVGHHRGQWPSASLPPRCPPLAPPALFALRSSPAIDTAVPRTPEAETHPGTVGAQSNPKDSREASRSKNQGNAAQTPVPPVRAGIKPRRQ